MSVEIAWKQNNLVTDFHLLKLLQVVFGLGLQAFVCDFSRQNICSVPPHPHYNHIGASVKESPLGFTIFLCISLNPITIGCCCVVIILEDEKFSQSVLIGLKCNACHKMVDCFCRLFRHFFCIL